MSNSQKAQGNFWHFINFSLKCVTIIDILYLHFSWNYKPFFLLSTEVLRGLNVRPVLLKSRYPGEGSPALIVESFTRTPRFLLFGFALGRDVQKPFANLSACRLFAEDNGSKWVRSKVARCYSEFAMNLAWC